MLVGVLDAIVRLVHPVMPFVAESIWQALNEAAFERGLPNPEPATESVMIAAWPSFPAEWQDRGDRAAHRPDAGIGALGARGAQSLQPGAADAAGRACALLGGGWRTTSARWRRSSRSSRAWGSSNAGPDVTKPPQAAGHVTPDFEAYVSLKGLIDPAAEIKRLEKQLAEKRKFLQGTQAKLANENFVKNAPPEVVQQQQEKVAEVRSRSRRSRRTSGNCSNRILVYV